MAQVQAVLEEKYGGEGDRSWFGHPGRPEQRLSVAGRAAGPQPPPSPTPDELALADARAAVCAQCEHLKRRGDGTPAITRTKTLSDGSIHQLHHVGCKPCGCGPVSLIRGSCFYRRWPIEPSPATAEG
jgi:hypothetical protein